MRQEAGTNRGTDLLVGGSLLLGAGAAGAIVAGAVAPRLDGARRTDSVVPGWSRAALAMVALGAKRRTMVIAPTVSSTTAGLTLTGSF